MGDGDRTRFWEDVWLGTCPIRIKFYNLFRICNHQKVLVAEVLRNGEINLSFRRNFEELEIKQWESWRRIWKVLF